MWYPLLVDLFNLYFKLCDNKDIVFAWVPGHVGIRGNNVVDLAAKNALEKSINRRMAVPYSDFKVLTNVYVKKLWESYPENKLQDSTQSGRPHSVDVRKQYYADYILVTLF